MFEEKMYVLSIGSGDGKGVTGDFEGEVFGVKDKNIFTWSEMVKFIEEDVSRMFIDCKLRDEDDNEIEVEDLLGEEVDVYGDNCMDEPIKLMIQEIIM